MEDTTTTKDILEFLRENMLTKEEAKNFATKDDIAALRLETKAEFAQVRGDIERLSNEMHREFDRIDAELVEIRKLLDKWELRSRQDTDVEAEDISSLRRRVEQLEKEVKTLRLQQAV